MSFGLAKTILQGTVNGKRRRGDRRRGGKSISTSGQGWTLPAQLGQPKTGQDGGVVVKPSVVLQRQCKFMGLD